MRSTTARRATAIAGCAVLGAASVVMTAGTAAGSPGQGSGVTRTVEGSAIGSLSSPDGQLGVILSVFDFPDRAAFTGVEIFGSTATSFFECFEGPQIEAALVRLKQAHAEGNTTLLCGGPDLPSDVVGHVEVDVDWHARGRVSHDRFTSDGCRVTTAIRQAEVTGRLTVRIPALDIAANLPEGVGDLRRTTSLCRD